MGQHQPGQSKNSHHEEHHIIPFEILRNVALGLIGLTILTVATARGIHLGVLAAPVAFGIAAAKAYMVMAYFMGLKYDTKQNRIIFASGFFFLAVLIIFCVIDIWTRVPFSSTL